MKRVLIFWMWNDKLSEEKIHKQLLDFKSQGIDGFFIHPMPSEFRPKDFPGGMPGYLSTEYFQMIKYTVECAKQLDMAAWLYDEAGWPSGTLNGYFRDHRPDLLIQMINAKGEISFGNFTPDLLNKEATQIFIEKTHEKYKEYVGEYFGTTIPGIFTDEPAFGCFTQDSLPYSPAMAEVFLQEKGYSLVDAAKKVLVDKDPVATIDYHEIRRKLIRESYLLPIQEWCHKNNLISTGHFNGDDCIDNAVRLLSGNLEELHDCLDIPGCDAIWRQIHPLNKETDFTRMTVSAAKDKPVLSETFAVYGTNLTLAEMKQVAGMQFVAGIKLLAPMAFHYSDEGGRQITTVSNLYGADCRWYNYKHFADFTRRMSKVSDRTTPIIKALVPFPVDDLCTNKVDSESIFPIGLALAQQQITYNYSTAAKTLANNIVSDVKLLTQEPNLRTRHLKSPRGERLIFVNAGLNDIDVTFVPPTGYSAWYDPSNGKHYAAVPNIDGTLSLKLPFAGVMVLLTIPGKAAQRPNKATPNNTLQLNLTYVGKTKEIKASPSGLIEVTPTSENNEYFAGTLLYETKVTLNEAAKAQLVLPNAQKAMLTVSVNGKCETKVWAPYLWELSLDKGENIIKIELSTTPHAALHEPGYRKYLQDNEFDNVYLHRCDEFAELFPNEEPLKDAFIRY